MCASAVHCGYPELTPRPSPPHEQGWRRLRPALSADNVPFLRLDSARFPTTLGFTAAIAPHSCWGARLGGQRLDSVKSIYYRRPGGFEFDPAIPPEMITWCEGQAQFGFWGVLESLPATWINSPGAVHLASCKPRQLEHAEAAGLKFPPTMVTNEPEAVAEFAAQASGRDHLGALDFVVTDEGHHFIEINPNGQWAFIETKTRQPISRALAAALGKGTT